MENPDDHETETSQRVQELIRQWRNRSVMSWPYSVVNTNFDGLNLSLRVSYNQWAFVMGHFADVHKGVMDGGSVVAVKILRLPELNPYNEKVYETTLQRFFRELNTWGELAHINIVQMLGFTLANGRIGLVSPWQENGTLVQYLRVNPTASQPDLMLDVAEGTQYLHTVAKLVHGDLKGLNVLVSENGIARLTDFGISQQMHDITRTTGFTTTSIMKGTPAWMAPENMEGLPLDFPSDIYSCAGVFLEIASGHHPYYYIPEVHEVVAAKMACPPDRRFYPELVNKDFLWQTLCHCWRLDPAGRPKIGEVVHLLYDNSKLGPRFDPTIALRPLVDAAQPPKNLGLLSPWMGLDTLFLAEPTSNQEEFEDVLPPSESYWGLTQRRDLSYQGSAPNSISGSIPPVPVIDPVRRQLHAAGAIFSKKRALYDIVLNRSRDDLLVKAGVQVTSLFVMVPTLVAISVGANRRPSTSVYQWAEHVSRLPSTSEDSPLTRLGDLKTLAGRMLEMVMPSQARSSADSRPGGGSSLAAYEPYHRPVPKPVRIAATAWGGSLGSAYSCGLRLYCTSSTYVGIQELSSSGVPVLSKVPSYVSTHFFDGDLLGLVPDDGFAVTSVERNGVLEELRLFYWARDFGVPEIRDLYWNPNMGVDWKRPNGGNDPRLSLRVQKADSSQVAAVSWHQHGHLFWSVFYIDDGYAKEVTRSTTVFSNWSRARTVYRLDFIKKIGSLQAIASVDGDHVHKAIYIHDSESQTLYTLPWSSENGGQKPTIVAQHVLGFTLCNSPARGFSSTRIYIQEAGSQGLTELRPPNAEGGSATPPKCMTRRQLLNGGRGIERPVRLASAIQVEIGGERSSVFYTDADGRLTMGHRGSTGEWEYQEELALL